jgi:hypothetical protein
MTMKLSTDPNLRRQQIEKRIVTICAPTLMPAVSAGGAFLFMGPAMAGTIGIVSLVIGGVMSLVVGVNGLEEPATRRPRPGTETHIGDMVETLVRISRTGVRPVDRPSVQNAIDKGAASLAEVVGEEPWVAMQRANRNRWNVKPIPVPPGAHPGDLGTMLSANCDLGMLGTARNGVKMSYAHASLAESLAAVVAIAEAFDLDTSGLAIGRRQLPGMASDRRQLTEAAARVHLLAARWKEGSTQDVDPILRLEADAAAGRDLRDLESVWAAARSQASPERILEIDRTYRSATEALERTLEAALEASGDRAVDALTTHATYIASKHAVAALT